MQSLLTAEEYAHVPNEHTELVDGQVVPMSPTNLTHGLVAGRIAIYLGEYGLRTGHGEAVTAETGFVTRRRPDRVRAPDVAYVKRERLSGRDLDAFFEGAPDVAVEVLSPSERATTVAAKVSEYLAAGTSLVLVVDPHARQIHAHRSGRATVVLGEGDVLEDEEVLPGFSLPVSKIFAR